MAKKKETYNEPPQDSIIQVPMEEVMHQSMIPYAEHVILERALPRVEDGLKPVQRRILFTMSELSLTPDKPHKKCARIVGDCLGKYHPHGDSSVYDAMVRMAQPFNMRGLLLDGHGNFGSMDGDSAAAMRYTEARMAPLALELLRDIEEDTVDFQLNFDDSLKEPVVLPGRFPNLLVNGASGIAVGLATNIPPHNLGEAIDAVVAQIEDPDITLEGLLQHMPGPDFPTGGTVVNRSAIAEAYRTGRGKLLVRAKVEIEAGTNGKTLLVIREIPYAVNKAVMLEKILKLSEEKKALFTGINDIRDESDREGMRAVIELKRDVDPQRILRALYRYSDLQVTFGVNMVAIAEGRPVQLGLKAIIAHYIRHQKEVLTRRTRHQLDAALARAHILEGLIIAIDNIDRMIAIIRAAKDVKGARVALMEEFTLTETQAQAILEMRLQRLTGLQILELRKEFSQLQKRIAQLEAILGSEKKLLLVIRTELLEIKARYADARRTQLLEEAPQEESAPEEVKLAEETVLVFAGSSIRRFSTKTYAKPPEDFAGGTVAHTDTDARLLLFTNLGNYFSVPVGTIPEMKWKDRPMQYTAIIGLAENEKVVTYFALKDQEYESSDLIFLTEKGMIKRSSLQDFRTKRSGAAVAIGLKPGDSLIQVERYRSDRDALLVSREGMSIRIHDLANEVPCQGRTAGGVRAMTLGARDRVVFAALIEDEGELAVITDRGYGKRSLIVDFEPQKRGGKGVKVFQFHPRGNNGTEIVGACVVTVPVRLRIRQHGGEESILESEQFHVEPRVSKGQPLVVALMDQVVTEMTAMQDTGNTP